MGNRTSTFYQIEYHPNMSPLDPKPKDLMELDSPLDSPPKAEKLELVQDSPSQEQPQVNCKFSAPAGETTCYGISAHGEKPKPTEIPIDYNSKALERARAQINPQPEEKPKQVEPDPPQEIPAQNETDTDSGPSLWSRFKTAARRLWYGY